MAILVLQGPPPPWTLAYKMLFLTEVGLRFRCAWLVERLDSLHYPSRSAALEKVLACHLCNLALTGSGR